MNKSTVLILVGLTLIHLEHPDEILNSIWSAYVQFHDKKNQQKFDKDLSALMSSKIQPCWIIMFNTVLITPGMLD